MQFESWQALGFGLPVLGGRREEGKRVSRPCLRALPGKPLQKLQEAQMGPLYMIVIWSDSVWNLSNTYRVQALCPGHSQVSEDGSLPSSRPSFTSGGGTGNSIDDSKTQPSQRPSGALVTGLGARLNVTGRAGRR